MLSWADAHRLGMLEATRTLQQLRLDPSSRVPVEHVADQLGLVVHYKPLPRLEGAYIVEPDGPSGMLINSKLPWSKQRFTIAHELGHHRFGHESSYDLETGTFASSLSSEERMAEAFAGWLLMPRRAVSAVTKSKQIESAADVYRLSLRLGVSYQAACLQLTNLRLVDRWQAKEWFSVPPKLMKQELLGTKSGLGWSDVHVVEKNDGGSTFFLQPGDIVTCPEATDVATPTASDDTLRVSQRIGAVQIEVVSGGPINPADETQAFELGVRYPDTEFDVTVVLDRKRLGIHRRWFGDDN